MRWKNGYDWYPEFKSKGIEFEVGVMRGEWPARWEPQEEGVMSIAAHFPSVKKPRFIVLGEERHATEGDAC
jgi:hypothetical protein